MTSLARKLLIPAVLIGWLCSVGEVAGQSPAARPPIPLGTRVGLPPSGYDDGGRRDPFVSLITPKVAPGPKAASTAKPGAGLAGVAVQDVQVKGVVRSGAVFVALLEGPDGRTFLAKRLDKLMDGMVKGIDRDAVTFTERVEDSAGAVRQRDVRKPLKLMVAGGQS